MDLDVGISPVMDKELQQLIQMISRVTEVSRPIPEASPTSHGISRFIPSIADTKVAKFFQTPNMKPYDGTMDPEEHIA